MLLDIKLSKQNIVNDVAAELNLYGRTLELTAAGKDQTADNLRELANYIRTPDDNETKPIVARSMQEAWNTVKESCQRYLVVGRIDDDNRMEAITNEVIKPIYCGADKFPYNDEEPSFPTVALFQIPFLRANTTYTFRTECVGSHSDPGTLLLLVGGKSLGEFTLDKVVSFQLKPEKDMQNAVLAVQKKDVRLPDIYLEEGTIFTVSYSHLEYGGYNLQLDMPGNFNVSVTSSITSHAHRLIVDSIVAAVLKNQQQDGYAKYLSTADTARLALIRSLQARNSFGRVQHDWT